MYSDPNTALGSVYTHVVCLTKQRSDEPTIPQNQQEKCKLIVMFVKDFCGIICHNRKYELCE